ncbi:cell division initiation protein [Malonomonas rubra DSM 5091]|uniref:Cell division initiation protein n=1 Tax=Malonomonas rubra DSM 5091 TaxID=1122189 RepID=A0A1M6BDY3_MALRU|nr:DivIVA domain-containing protein [Malonomonas rubra]SHI46952.1 cell division initiation protein [Malonomonas rubra DSM 5091]
MRITPIEIQQHQFKSRLFGYDTAAVDHFLEMLADEIERLHKQNNELKESLARTRTSLEQMRDREKALQETLMTAQQVTEELKENARKEAEVMIAEAHLEGEHVVRDAAERRVQLLSEIQELKRQKISFETGLRSLVEGHLKLLDLDIMQLEEEEKQASLLDHDQPLLDRLNNDAIDLP